MPKPLWRGRQTNLNIYKDISNFQYFVKSIKISKNKDESDYDFLDSLKFYRRNVYLNTSVLDYFTRSESEPEIYNGYDFIPKSLDEGMLNYNLSTLVSTREINVVHKVKQSKHQRKANAANMAKKKTLGSAKGKAGVSKKNKNIKKVIKK